LCYVIHDFKFDKIVAMFAATGTRNQCDRRRASREHYGKVALAAIDKEDSMPSPFPGMDPYIEQPEVWSDFHTNLVTEIQGQLNPVIHPKYAVAACYKRGGYDVIINYTRDVPPPKLSQEDELWVDQLLRTKGCVDNALPLVEHWTPRSWPQL
jgi:hypothetical protein